MNQQPLTKFLLDSGDPEEFKEIKNLASENKSELWGATTNPSLIAKKLTSKKVSQKEAFELQKQIVLEVLDIVPGSVSTEVYTDEKTRAEEMVAQGKDIATWHERVTVKLPTTIEGFKARTALRTEGIHVNNTLVFSQEQIFAICLHEMLIQVESEQQTKWPCFISPFVGRLDDVGVNGMDLVKNGMRLKQEHGFDLWMLEASVRNNSHVQEGLDCQTELITAPAKVYKDWFSSESPQSPESPKSSLTPIPYWDPSEELLEIDSIEAFMEAIENNSLNIQHELTDKGIVKFADDWKAIISS